MIKVLSVISVFLLFFTGITASIGGFMLIYDPTGRPLKMSISILAGSPFSSFFIPGIILFLFIGVSSILIAFYVLNDYTYSTRLILYQGIVLLGWIAGQLILINEFHFLQLLYTLISVALIYAGYYGVSVKKKGDKEITAV
jgi:hypothetical protein